MCLGGVLLFTTRMMGKVVSLLLAEEDREAFDRMSVTHFEASCVREWMG